MPLRRREEVRQTAPLVKVGWLTFAAALCGTETGLPQQPEQKQGGVVVAHDCTFGQFFFSHLHICQIRVTELAELFFWLLFFANDSKTGEDIAVPS